jgi:hypothetical protein
MIILTLIYIKSGADVKNYGYSHMVKQPLLGQDLLCMEAS